MQITTLDVQPDGVLFASAGLDRVVKLWLYDEGDLVASGVGHSGAINRVRISPDARVCVSVGEEGAIFIWGMPGASASASPKPLLAPAATAPPAVVKVPAAPALASTVAPSQRVRSMPAGAGAGAAAAARRR